MNMAAEVVPGLTPSAGDYVVSHRTATDPASVSPSSSTTTSDMTSSMTSPQHVEFQVETDDVNVNDKMTRRRFLTAKYPKHQMGLIRRRLVVEDWIDEQLKVLFNVVRDLSFSWAPPGITGTAAHSCREPGNSHFVSIRQVSSHAATLWR